MCFKMSFVPDGKAEFLAAIIPVISITWSFRNADL